MTKGSHPNSFSDSYKKAGVDITAGYEAVERMRAHIARTNIPGVLSAIGGFGGMFAPNMKDMREPVLVSGTDGVGTKLKLAFLMDKHDTIGIDCVAMCVNDIICCGAQPLFFLDYIALGKNVPARVEAIVSGVADGCVQAGCALIGGETAEMPGFYAEGEYDIAGFSVGMVDKASMLSNESVRSGDVLISLPSSGPHSNGYSLIRRIFGIGENASVLHTYRGELGMTLGEALLTPTRIYVRPVLELLPVIKSAAHITGGGFYENIPRALPQGLTAKIERKALAVPLIFDLIRETGNIDERDMFNTFNMGTGMMLVIGKQDADNALARLKAMGVEACIAGETAPGEQGVVLC